MKGPFRGFMPNEALEELTARRLRDYERKTGQPLTLPVPAEEMIEQVLDLCILWEVVEEQRGEMILAGLKRRTRTIVVNETHLKLFEEKPGLLRSTLGHEAGHWDIECRPTLGTPSLFGEDEEGEAEGMLYRHSSGGGQIEVLRELALRSEEANRIYRSLTAGQDTPEQKSNVDRYQSCLLMPRWLMVDAAKRYDLRSWPSLYRFAEEAQVSISNLTTRLRRLKLIHSIDGQKRICLSAGEVSGQGDLF